MQTIRITTSQNIDIDYEIAGVGERILARLIDIGILIAIVFAVVIGGVISGGRQSNFDGIGLVLMCILGFTYVFYDLLCEIFMNGQSVGKRVMKIKVISLDGAQPGIGQYLLRWVFRVVDFSLTGGVCALISVSVSKNSQRVGDMVAGTSLIKTAPRTKMESIAFTPSADDYQPVFTEAAHLSDRDIALMHEVLANYYQSGNYELLVTTSSKLKGLLAITTSMDDMRFLQTLIKDYNHYAAAAHTV